MTNRADAATAHFDLFTLLTAHGIPWAATGAALPHYPRTDRDTGHPLPQHHVNRRTGEALRSGRLVSWVRIGPERTGQRFVLWFDWFDGDANLSFTADTCYPRYYSLADGLRPGRTASDAWDVIADVTAWVQRDVRIYPEHAAPGWQRGDVPYALAPLTVVETANRGGVL